MGVGYVAGAGPVGERHGGVGIGKGRGSGGRGKKSGIIVVRKLEGGVESCSIACMCEEDAEACDYLRPLIMIRYSWSMF